MNEFKLLLRKDIFILLNNIKLILKNPLRLLPYAFVIGYFSFFYFRKGKKSGEIDTSQVENLTDAAGQIEEVNFALQNISGGLTLLALIFLMFKLYQSTKKNVSFFSMADVNLLFTSPASASNILLYYMIRAIFPATGGAFLFTLYSTAQLNEHFDLNILNLGIMSMGIMLFFFILSPLRFLVYTLNTKYNILPLIKNGVFGLGLILGLLVLIPGLMAEKFWQGMFSWIGSPWFDFFPLVGWSRGILTYLAHENLGIAIGFISAYFLSFILIVQVVLSNAGYYYEDVLESTKSNEEIKEKAKGKREASESSLSINAKKKLELKNFGQGAVALYWRNYVNSSRQDFHPLFGVYGLAFAGIAIIFAVLSHFDWFSHKVIYGYLLTLITIYFFAGMGRTNVGDLKKPYFILIPASWTSKFWNMIKLDIYQTLIFAFILIIPTVLIAKLSIGLILLFPLCMVMFYSTGFAIALSTVVGFDEGWDRKLIKPLIIGGVFIFGIAPSLGAGFFSYLVSQQFVYALLGTSVGMIIVAAIMLHVTLDIISRLEFKEM
ncbi:putative ABC exporter domain-containing protein [Shivajiella indica]|uniref:ABC exporter domain-containing protein n=1 Tax=Shivajiella indica TaxID=872115 RepID=A0ABW5B9D0_9BACT